MENFFVLTTKENRGNFGAMVSREKYFSCQFIYLFKMYILKALILESQKTRFINLISIHYNRLFQRSLKRHEVEYRASVWKEIADNVNGLGAVKTVDQWKKYWAQMKKKANDKIVFIQQYRKKTGRQENCPIKLNANEESVISITNEGLSVRELLRINEPRVSESEFSFQQPVETVQTTSLASSNIRRHHSSNDRFHASNSHHHSSNNRHQSSNSRDHSSNNRYHSHNNQHHCPKQSSWSNRHRNRYSQCTCSNHGNGHCRDDTGRYCRCAPSTRLCGNCYLPISVSSEQDNTNRIVAEMCKRQDILFDQVKICLCEVKKLRTAD